MTLPPASCFSYVLAAVPGKRRASLPLSSYLAPEDLYIGAHHNDDGSLAEHLLVSRSLNQLIPDLLRLDYDECPGLPVACAQA